MMNLHIDGLDRLSVSYATLSQLSDDEIWGIIEPAAGTLKTRMQDVIARLFRQRSGSLRESIEVTRKISKGGAVFALVGPNQAKHHGSTTGKRKAKRAAKKRRTGTNGSYSGTNAEVGWILEYGSERISPGFHWMETACDEAEEELMQQLEQGFDAVCTAAGL